MEWARDRSTLWTAARRAENRKGSRVARELLVTFPSELPTPRSLRLARTFSQDVADRYNVAVDLVIHEQRAGDQAHSAHAHLLMTTREVTPDGLGQRAELELQPEERVRRGLPERSRELIAIRETWVRLASEELRDASVEEIRHRARATWQARAREDATEGPRQTVRDQVRTAEPGRTADDQGHVADAFDPSP